MAEELEALNSVFIRLHYKYVHYLYFADSASTLSSNLSRKTYSAEEGVSCSNRP